MIQDEPMPGSGLLVPDRAPGPRRAAAVAYLIISTFVVGDEPHTQAREFPARADGPRRTANVAYSLPFPKFVVQDEPEECQRPVLPDVARGWRRAANDAYEVHGLPSAQIAPVVDPQELLDGRSWPDVANGPRRAARTAYDIAATFVVQSEPEECQRVVVPDRAPGPRRTANTAYHVAAFVPPPDDLPLAVRPILPDRAPGPVRTARTAYDIAASFVVQGEPQTGTTEIIPDRAPGPRRTAATAYDIPPRLQGLDFVEPERSEYRVVWPSVAPGPKRAAASAYDVEQRPPTPEIVPLTQKNVTTHGRPPNP